MSFGAPSSEAVRWKSEFYGLGRQRRLRLDGKVTHSCFLFRRSFCCFHHRITKFSLKAFVYKSDLKVPAETYCAVFGLKKGKHGVLELTLSVALINLRSLERAEKLFSLSDVVLCGTESF